MYDTGGDMEGEGATGQLYQKYITFSNWAENKRAGNATAQVKHKPSSFSFYSHLSLRCTKSVGGSCVETGSLKEHPNYMSINYN